MVVEDGEELAPGWFLPRRITLKRHVRRMQGDESGGSEPQVLEDTDSQFWMVKAPNQRQGLRVLASEVIAGSLSKRIGAATPEIAICAVTAELAAAITFADGQSWAAGDAFGSALVDGAAPYVAAMNPTMENREAALLVVALDTWLAAYDGRQSRVTTNPATGLHTVYGVDFGHSIGSGTWDAAALAAQAAPTALIDPQGWSTPIDSATATAAAETLRSVSEGDLQMIVGAVPASWGVPTADQDALLSYLVQRQEPVAKLLDKLA